MNSTNKDQFGYYLVGDYKTYSKIAALERANLVNIPVEWIFNDSVFSTHPWKIDTGVDIKILYKKRAEQIRNKYDYIVIWYSGGVDSFTMLNTFKENNIHVDEIAQYHAYEGEKTWDSYLNKELELVAIPQTQEFLKKMPHTKHRMIDLTPIINSVYDIDDNKFDFIYKSNKSFGPDQLARTYFREKVSDWQKIIASGKKLCFVWATDKPPVRHDILDDKYYLEFIDIIDGAGVGPRTQMLNRPEEHDELFYWSPDAMDLMARQGHIIANYMRNPPKEDLDSKYLTRDRFIYLLDLYGSPKVVSKNMDRRTATKIGNDLFYLTVQGLNRLVYPDWREDTFTLGKNIGYIFGPRDRWWWEGHRAKDRIMFRTAFESYYDKFTKYGFSGYKLSKKVLTNPTEVRLDKILDRIGVTFSPENVDKKNTANLKKHIVGKYGSTLSYVDDFKNLNLDSCCSQKYYL